MLGIIKLIGIIAVIVSCSLIGFYKSYSLKQRHLKIQSLISALDVLYEHINYGDKELPHTMKFLYKQCPFLQISDGVTRCEDRDLTAEENQLINDFFNNLGRNGKQAECERIMAFKGVLAKRQSAAQEDSAQKCRLWQTGGVCIGIAAAIMMI